MSDDYSSNDGGSCDSGSSYHSDCSHSSSDPAPCSSSSNVDNQLADDLLMYGIAAQIMSADAGSGEVRRERVAPEDFVIMSSRFRESPYNAAVRARDEQPMVTGDLNVNPVMKPGKVAWIMDDHHNEASSFAWFLRGFSVGAGTVAMAWIIWSVI